MRLGGVLSGVDGSGAGGCDRAGVEDPLVPTGSLCGERVRGGIAGAIDWALAVNKDDRPQSVGAWREVLSGEGVGVAPVAPSSAEPAGSPVPSAAPVASGSNRVLWVVFGLCLAVILGLGGYWGLGQIEEARQEQAVAGEVSSLLSSARADLSAGRLTSPAGNNAWEKYQGVLRLVPGHVEAQAGLDQIIVRYGALFDEALSSGDFGLASGYISRVREVYPDASVLRAWGRRLGSAQALAVAAAARRNGRRGWSENGRRKRRGRPNWSGNARRRRNGSAR